VSAVLTPDLIVASGTATTRDEAIQEAGDLLLKVGAVTADYVEAMHERERTVSTYMGNFLAIPHGTNEAKEDILRSAVSFVRYPGPLDWNGHEVRVVVGIAGLGNEHLGILSKIAVIFSDKEEAQKLLDATTADELYRLLEAVNAE
jgi:PTS system mannitol-specific IIA component